MGKNIYRHFLLWLMSTKFYYWMLMRIIPYVRFSVYYTSLRGWKYLRGYKLLKTGDFMVAVDRKKLTAMLIPGEWTHASICVGKGDEWEVSEMTHHNYTKSAFFDICKESDRVAILRCRDWDEAYIKKVVANAKGFQDATYDVDFTLGVKALYCSELVYQSDSERRLQVNLEDLAGLGTPYISPTGLAQGKNVTVVWDSDDEEPADPEEPKG